MKYMLLVVQCNSFQLISLTEIRQLF